MLLQSLTSVEVQAADKLLERGALGVVVVFAIACAWFIWKLICKFTASAEKAAEQCDVRADKRSAEFLGHNKQIVEENSERMCEIAERFSAEQTQTRLTLDRVLNKLDQHKLTQ